MIYYSTKSSSGDRTDWKNGFENHFKHERDLLKKLINNGQFEILNGGWGINDETISHYTGIIEESLIWK